MTAAVLINSFCGFPIKPYKKNMRERLPRLTKQLPVSDVSDRLSVNARGDAPGSRSLTNGS